MKISDALYGEYMLEDVLSALIESKEIQRLKDVHMAGAAYLVDSCWNETRYEHSVGVMLLIRCLGGSLEEQIAGLLHDVSHTAFSHLIDFVMKNTKEDFHEEIKEQQLKESTIPAILAEYGYDYTTLLLDDDQWSILEQSAPDICADRIDYTLREIHRYFDVPLTEIHGFIKAMEIIDGKIVLTELFWGEWFVDQYKKIVIDFFYAPLNVYSCEIVGKMLAHSLKTGVVTESDLHETDTFLWQKMTISKDRQLHAWAKQLRAKISFAFVDEDSMYDLHQQKKVRYVDPLIEYQGDVISVSKLSQSAAEQITQMIEQGEKGIYLSYRIEEIVDN